MHLIDNNINGRIYISKFEIEKQVYLFLNANFSDINCYVVKYCDDVITLNIKKVSGLRFERINVVQAQTLDYIKNNMGIYISRIDVEIK